MLGETAAIITAILWSITPIAFTEASIRVGPIYVNITRMFFALIFLMITMIVIGINVNLSLYQIGNLIISGLAGLVVGDTFLLKAYRLIGARISMLIMSIVPPISATLAFFFLDEKISFFGIVGIFITIAGIGIVVLQRQEKPSSHYKIDYTGIFYAMIGALGQAVGLIFAKFAFNAGEINGFLAGFTRIFSAVIIFYPLAVLTKRYNQPIKVFRENKKGLLFTIIGSVFGPYLGITFSLIAISHTKVGVASTIMATVPIIMLPLVRLYYKEKLTRVSIAGAILAVGGIAILFLN